MKALLLKGPMTFEYADVEPAERPRGWVRIRIRHVGICGSDVHYYAEGRLGREHECIRAVENRIGDIGRLVVVGLYRLKLDAAVVEKDVIARPAALRENFPMFSSHPSALGRDVCVATTVGLRPRSLPTQTNNIPQK